MIAPVRVRLASRYELLEALGEGGMGVVYRALDTKTGSYVAIKTMRDISDPDAVELFAKEWKVLSEISHPNIVDVRDVDVIEENGQRRPFFVMPLLPGVTLAHLIETASPRLSVERVVMIMSEVCRGLQAAHQRGLVHRDLKPSNIFVGDDDTAKIIDFGVVHLAGSKSVTGHKGTWQYMAPEQAELKAATPISDIFSLGVVCYEALTLRKPFARKTPAETIEAILKHIPPPVSQLNPNVSQLVSMVIHKALAKQPLYRFTSARDFSENLQKAYRNQSIDRFDRAKIRPRVERAQKAFSEGDYGFASDILTEIEAEGHIDPEITLLRGQVDEAITQKKIRQLLEGARARLEQGEIPLALDKVREVLQLDPENPDALMMRGTIETQRNQGLVDGWLVLARQHLERYDFAEARQAAREVLSICPGDKQAADLLVQIDTTEKEASRIRSQKEQLYGSALKAYHNGEISSVLSTLERVLTLARNSPEAAIPERDAVYQSFYNQVRSERDSIQTGYAEGRRYLSEKNFAKALEVCESFLGKYPQDPLFKALKLEAVEGQRQELSSFIAEVGRKIEAEPDLDRRVNILREACERYPNEQQFAQSLKLVRDRRELINSIVAKARQYEERAQFTEAIGQWDILKNIHPQYPGIDLEVDQLVRRRSQQARDDEKVRYVEQTDGLLASGSYAKARDLVLRALQDFPSDPELSGLAALANQGLERSEQASRLCAEGQQACSEGRHAEGASLLRNALKLQEHNPVIRNALVNALVEQARQVIDKNWLDAEPFLAEGSELDAKNPAVRSLRAIVTDAKRKEYVAQCLAEARQLQALGSLQEARARLDQGLAEYPNDPRLEQYRSNLKNLMQEAHRTQERKHDELALQQYLKQLEQKPAAADLKSILEQSVAIRRRHPDDSEIAATYVEIEQIARRSGLEPGDATGLFLPAGQNPKPQLKPNGIRNEPYLAPASTKDSEKQESAGRKARVGWFTRSLVLVREGLTKGLAATARAAAGTKARLEKLTRNRWSWRVGISLAAIVLVSTAILLVRQRQRTVGEDGTGAGSAKVANLVQFRVATDPADADVKFDGTALTGGTAQAQKGSTHAIEVSRLGYRTKVVTLTADSDVKFTLEPEPLHVHIATGIKQGSVYLDAAKIGDLADGNLPDYEVAPDGNTHALRVSGPKGDFFTLDFQAIPGAPPRVSPIKTAHLLAVSNLGGAASIYSGTTLRNVTFGDQSLANITGSGVDLPAVTAQQHVVDYGMEKKKASVDIGMSAVPSLWISFQTSTSAAVLLAKDAPGSGTVPAAPSTSSSVLIVEGGTPEALVSIDSVKVGQLDASGNGRFERVAYGPHAVGFEKDGFEGWEGSESFASAPVRLNEVKLKPLGTLIFKPSPADASITFKLLPGDVMQRWNGQGPALVKSGTYEVVGEAPHYQRTTKKITVVAGENTAVPLVLIPTVAVTNRAGQVATPGSNDWYKSDELLYVQPASITLLFPKDRKLQWVFLSGDGNERIEYQIDNQRLTHKLVQDDKVVDTSDKGSPVPLYQGVFALHFEVSSDRVKVTANGTVVDECALHGYDFAHGKFGIKPGHLFFAREN